MNKTLYVDLDGTLVKTDTLLEALLTLIKSKPMKALALPLWLLKGKAGFKEHVSHNVQIQPQTLPYNGALIEYLREENESGTELVLATAAHRSVAEAVAKHTGLFAEVFSTEGRTNLSGKAKLDAIRRRTREFDYAGNANADLPIWKEAHGAVVVGPRSIRDKASRLTNVVRWFAPEQVFFKLALRALRPHQWAKNVLVLLPAILAHEWQSSAKLWMGLWVFVSFSLVASSVYVINDLFDLESDRAHPEKKRRPLASGDLSITSGILLAAMANVAGFSIAMLVSTKLFLALMGYFVLTTMYSFKLKRVSIVDGFTLATLYSWRIVTGGVMTEVPITFWLIAFCMFFFLSLAFAKRATELLMMKHLNRESAAGRGYAVGDLDIVRLLGVGSGIASVIVLAMYMNHPGTQVLYKSPSYLLGAAIALFYWICRVWVKTDRREMNSDPIVFAIKDKVSYGILALISTFAILAMHF